MSPEAQRIAIAEACGWYIHDPACPTGVTMWKHTNHPYGWRETSGLPDYRNDLNAMHEAEKALTPGQWMEYPHALHAILHDYDECDSFEGYGQMFLRATAAQRSEAFLRTLGKWEVA